MSRAAQSSMSLRREKMSRAPVPALAKRSSSTWRPGVSPRVRLRRVKRSGPPSKSRTNMPKLPSVSGERVVRALKPGGFIELRQKGSHVSLEKHTSDRVFKTVVRIHGELAKGTLSDILKQCGLAVEEFLDLL